MKRQTIILFLVLTTLSAMAQPDGGRNRAFQASFIFSTDGIYSVNNTYNTSVNFLGGVVGGVNGAEFGGLFNVDRFSTNGAQFAGLFNISNQVNGAQFAGLFNFGQRVHGVQIAGLYNIACSGDETVQVGGLFNYVRKDNATTQVAPLSNVANKVRCQVGLINLASKSKVQVGLINISDTASVMVGLINISRDGFMELEAGGGEFLHATAAFRSGRKQIYGIMSVGYNFDDEFWGFGAGIGTTFEFKNNWGINIEAIQYSLTTIKFQSTRNNEFVHIQSLDEYNGYTQLRPLFYYQFSPRMKLFFGPVINFYYGDNVDNNQTKISEPYTIYSHYGSNRFEFWIGGTAGIRFNLGKVNM